MWGVFGGPASGSVGADFIQAGLRQIVTGEESATVIRSGVALASEASGNSARSVAIHGDMAEWIVPAVVGAVETGISIGRSSAPYEPPTGTTQAPPPRTSGAPHLLRDADGIIFVVDSQAGRLPANLDEQEKLYRDLRSRGIDPATKPIVFQINKRDLVNTMSANRIREELEADGVYVESVALQGTGVCEALTALIELLRER